MEKTDERSRTHRAGHKVPYPCIRIQLLLVSSLCYRRESYSVVVLRPRQQYSSHVKPAVKVPPSELIARYMALSSAKSLTLDLTWSGRSFIYASKSMGPRTEPCGTPEDTAILSDLTQFFKQQLENENPKSF